MREKDAAAIKTAAKAPIQSALNLLSFRLAADTARTANAHSAITEIRIIFIVLPVILPPKPLPDRSVSGSAALSVTGSFAVSFSVSSS